MKKSERLYIIIIGCGRLGSYLANQLSNTGHSIVVIDNQESAFEQLETEYSGFRIEGNATEFNVLKQAKIDKADMVLATTHDDNLNIMVAQIAKKIFKIKNVVARVFDPEREKIYNQMGIDTVCPTIVSGEIFLNSISDKTTRIEQD